jgi:hypothetical protein
MPAQGGPYTGRVAVPELPDHIGTYGRLCRAAAVGSTGPSPPDRGVQHQPHHPSQPDVGGSNADLNRLVDVHLTGEHTRLEREVDWGSHP